MPRPTRPVRATDPYGWRVCTAPTDATPDPSVGQEQADQLIRQSPFFDALDDYCLAEGGGHVYVLEDGSCVVVAAGPTLVHVPAV